MIVNSAEQTTNIWFRVAYGIRCDVPDNRISQRLHETMRLYVNLNLLGGKLPLEYFPWLKYEIAV